VTDEPQEPDVPSIPSRSRRLNSMGAVRRELARLYDDARNGKAKANDAAKLAYILTCLQKCLEFEVIEKRLDALEGRVNSGAQ
jgi:hypothetical protein